jgi:hypothetical protein
LEEGLDVADADATIIEETILGGEGGDDNGAGENVSGNSPNQAGGTTILRGQAPSSVKLPCNCQI